MATREYTLTVSVLYSIAVSLVLCHNDSPMYLRELPSGQKISCKRCPPGFHLLEHCTETRGTVCQPCDVGFYTAHWNYISDCLPCNWCSSDQVVTQECTGSSNRMCGCKKGFYWDSYMCRPHTVCPKGFEVKEKGTSDRDTVCEPCRDGFYASGQPGNTQCVPHTECQSEEKLLFRGTNCVDNVCVPCSEITHNDWVKHVNKPFLEIFKNHSSRKLNHFIKHLDGLNGVRVFRSVMEHNARIQKLQQWFSEATEQEVISLPKLLQKHGMRSLANKIEHRIKRIQDEINLCRNDSLFYSFPPDLTP